MSKLYEIVIFTASLGKYADPLLDILDKEKLISYRLFREHCTPYGSSYVKDLSRLGRDLDKIIIVDNSIAAYALQPKNAIPISTWLDDLSDSELLKVANLLENLAKADCKIPDILPKFIIENKIDYEKVEKYFSKAEKSQPVQQERHYINSKNNLLLTAWKNQPNIMKTIDARDFIKSNSEFNKNDEKQDKNREKLQCNEEIRKLDERIVQIDEKIKQNKAKIKENIINHQRKISERIHPVSKYSNNRPSINPNLKRSKTLMEDSDFTKSAYKNTENLVDYPQKTANPIKCATNLINSKINLNKPRPVMRFCKVDVTEENAHVKNIEPILLSENQKITRRMRTTGVSTPSCKNVNLLANIKDLSIETPNARISNNIGKIISSTTMTTNHKNGIGWSHTKPTPTITTKGNIKMNSLINTTKNYVRMTPSHHKNSDWELATRTFDARIYNTGF